MSQMAVRGPVRPGPMWVDGSARAWRRIRRLNLTVGLVHLAQGVAMLVVSSALALPVTASFLRQDPVTVQGPTMPEKLFAVPIGPAVALFLLLAAADHLLVAAPGLHRRYEHNLAAQRSTARWSEYAFSASLMLVLIALFVGIRDVSALVALFAANSAMILFGLLMERHQLPGAADWRAFWFGSLIGAVPWGLIFLYVAEAPRVPGFVWAITVTQLVLFAAFAANMALHYGRVGRWRDHLFGERVYIGLSLVAKSLLAWLIYANVLRT